VHAPPCEPAAPFLAHPRTRHVRTQAVEGITPAPVVRGKFKVMGRTVNAKPMIPLQKTENLNLFLEILTKDKGIKLVNIGADDLVLGKMDLVLGLSWELILFYELGGRTAGVGRTTSGFGGGGGDSKELLEWVQEATAGYEGIDPSRFDGLGVWKSGFNDGLPFCAILDSRCKGVIDYEKVKAMPVVERLRECPRPAVSERRLPSTTTRTQRQPADDPATLLCCHGPSSPAPFPLLLVPPPPSLVPFPPPLPPLLIQVRASRRRRRSERRPSSMQATWPPVHAIATR
jgi:hypothetical protein